MVPAQSLLPDGQSIIQQVGRLLVFVLIPDRQTETHNTQMNTITDERTKKRNTNYANNFH